MHWDLVMHWDLIHPKSWLPHCFGGFEFGNFTDYGQLEAKLHAFQVSGFVLQNPKTNLALVFRFKTKHIKTRGCLDSWDLGSPSLSGLRSKTPPTTLNSPAHQVQLFVNPKMLQPDEHLAMANLEHWKLTKPHRIAKPWECEIRKLTGIIVWGYFGDPKKSAPIITGLWF